MEAKTWERICSLVAEVLERPKAERRRYFEEKCPEDPAVRKEAKALLAIDTAILDDEDLVVFELLSRDPATEAQETGRFGPYEAIERLGRGGMSDVYLGQRSDGLPPREVAIKVLRGDFDLAAGRDRLYREGEILGRLRHPNIANVFSGGITEDGRPFLIMERIHGEPIDAYCRRHRLGLEQRLRLFLAVCHAVDAAHKSLIVHRDLKPNNILVTSDGQPKLLDFGISKLLDREEGRRAATTMPGLRALTPEYASPEQVQGLPVTVASDIHSLGVLLYLLLVGRLPFDPDSVEGLLHSICQDDPPKASARKVVDQAAGLGLPAQATISSWRRGLRGDLDVILAKAMRKEPEHRYASAKELADDLQCFLEYRPVKARSGSMAYSLTKALRRHRVRAPALVVSALLLIGIGIERLSVHRQVITESAKAEATRDLLLEIFHLTDPRLNPTEDLSVSAVLGIGAERIDQLDQHPILQAHLLSVLSEIHLNMGKPQEAEDLSRRSLRLNHAHAGEAAAETAESRRLLGQALSARWQLEESNLHLQRSYETFTRTHPEASKAAMALATLAVNYHRLGLEEQAWQAIEKSEKLCHENDLDISEAMALTLQSKTEILIGRRDGAAATATIEESLEVWIELYGAHHPWVAVGQANLANFAIAAGDLAKAERHNQQALAIWASIEGEPGRMEFAALVNQARIQILMGNPAQALPDLEALVPLISKTLDAKDPIHVHAATWHGKALAAEGSVERAKSELRRAISYAKAHFDENAVLTSYPLIELGQISAASEPELAVALLQEAFEIQSSHWEPGDLRLERTRTALEEASLKLAANLSSAQISSDATPR